MNCKTLLLAVLSLVLLSAPDARADVIVVDVAGGGDFTTLTAAVAASLDGDVLLIKEGTYNEPAQVVVDGKSLSLVGDLPSSPFGPVTTVQPGLIIRNLPPNKHVVIQNLTLYGVPSSATMSALPGLILEDNDSHVRLQSCNVHGGGGAHNDHPDGTVAVLMDGSASVSIVGGFVEGGYGQFSPGLSVKTGHGDAGIRKLDGQLALYDTFVLGGGGGSNNVGGWPTGGHGGTGLENLAGQVFMVGTSAEGGMGGIAHNGGDGGDGVLSAFGGTVQMMGGAGASGGDGGWSDEGPDGADGQATVGAIDFLGGPFRDFDVTSPLREGQVGTLDFAGATTETALLFLSFDLHLLPFPAYKGVLMLSPSVLLGPFGIGPPGNLEVPFTVPELGPGFEAVTLHLQAAYSGIDGVTLGSSAVLTLLDGAF